MTEPLSKTEQTAAELSRQTKQTASALEAKTVATAVELEYGTRYLAEQLEIANAKRFSSMKRWAFCLIALNALSTVSITILATNFIQFVQGFVAH